MITVNSVAAVLEQFAPPELAESWDNVGFLVGDRQREVRRVMTCLSITADSAAEAVADQADLIVTHHPLPFAPLRQITTDSYSGGLLLKLIEAGISVYSAHTAFDSAAQGINQQLAVGLGLTQIEPLRPGDAPHGALGAGRRGELSPALSIDELASRVQKFLGTTGLHVVGEERPIARVAVACGSGGEFLEAAKETGCDALVTGEARFHSCLEAEAAGVALLLPGHYASERFAMEWLATYLQQQLPSTSVWASRREHDPLHWVDGRGK